MNYKFRLIAVAMPFFYASLLGADTLAINQSTGPDRTSKAYQQESLAAPGKTVNLLYPEPPAPEASSAGRKGSPSDAVDGSFRISTPRYAGECVVDFNDSDTLALTQFNLWFDRVYVPWTQNCGGAGWTNIRVKKYGHFHLGFVDSDVLPCATDAQAYPSRLDEDGNCNFVAIESEPRSYLTTHWGDEWVQASIYNDDSQSIPFDLNRVRITGQTPVRLCYRKVQETDLDDLAYEAAGEGNTGIWLCWNNLDIGTWDLSNWAWNITDVKITGADGSAPFSIDEFRFGIQ